MTRPWLCRWCGTGSLTLLLGLSGCHSIASAPEISLPFAVPPAWSSAEAGTRIPSDSLAQWWLRFGDPLLVSLVTKAMRSNTSVNGAQATLHQAQALRNVAAAALFPTLGSSASVHRGNAAQSPTVNNFNAGLNAGWELDIFGANRSALKASEANASASAASLGEVQVSIAAEVALNYITLRASQLRLTIAMANLASQLETLQITQWRQQAGLVTELDTEQARAAAEQTRAQVPPLQVSIGQALHALAVLTGQPPSAQVAALTPDRPIPQAPPDLAVALPRETLRQRADVKAAEFQVTASVARVAQARAVRAPDFSLGGSLGLSALTLGTLGNSASVVHTVLANVAFPLFDGGAARAQVRAQEAALDQSLTSYRAAVLTALKDVEDALVALQGDRERLQPLQTAARAATAAADLARQRYGGGLIDFQTVLETQRTQFGAQDAVALAVGAVSADHVQLYKALGGGWTPDATDAQARPVIDGLRIPPP